MLSLENLNWIKNDSSMAKLQLGTFTLTQIGRLSPADAPCIRYAEVLLNYVEARYEIA